MIRTPERQALAERILEADKNGGVRWSDALCLLEWVKNLENEHETLQKYTAVLARKLIDIGRIILLSGSPSAKEREDIECGIAYCRRFLSDGGQP